MRLAASVAFAVCLAWGGALAASPEDDYVAARDLAITAMGRLDVAKADPKSVWAAHEKARADLQNRLEPILGPFAVPGFPAAGKLNLESLFEGDLGFGMVDEIVHRQGDNGPSVVVTTRGLLERWLKAKAAEKDESDKLPADIGAALALDVFYTQAISSDAAFSTTAELAVKKPEGADFVAARLGGWAQMVGPFPPQDIIVVLGKGGRVFIADTPLKMPLAKFPACEAVWKAAEKASETLSKAYIASGDKDEKLDKESMAAEDKGDRDFRACVGERLRREPAYAAIVREAQNLADRLASH